MPFYTADIIFDGNKFLSPNSSIQVHEDGTILNVYQHKQPEEVIHLKGLLCPGFINTHCHLELSHLKNKLAEKSGLVNFLLAVNNRRKDFSDEMIKEAIALAEQEMIVNGIVAVGDISNTGISLDQKAKGHLHYHTFVECFGLQEAEAEKRFHDAKELQLKFNRTLHSSIVLHAPYSASKKLIELVDTHAKHSITCIHNQESDEENKLFKEGEGDFLRLFGQINGSIKPFEKTGRRSLPSYLPLLKQQHKIILVHNTFSNMDDIHWAQSLNKELYWCLCPNANLYIENKLPAIDLLMTEGCVLVLGTDSLASNWQLSILAEIITVQKYFPAISLEKILSWATINGAKALGMDSLLGSFEIGKKPGILNIEGLVDGVIQEESVVRRLR